jgi:hypothetical protein
MKERTFELDKMAAYTLLDHLAQNMYFNVGAFYKFKPLATGHGHFRRYVFGPKKAGRKCSVLLQTVPIL